MKNKMSAGVLQTVHHFTTWDIMIEITLFNPCLPQCLPYSSPAPARARRAATVENFSLSLLCQCASGPGPGLPAESCWPSPLASPGPAGPQLGRFKFWSRCQCHDPAAAELPNLPS